jgi:hypothetical protein
MTPRATYRLALVVVGLLAAACNDPIASVGTDNRPELTNQPDLFHYRAWDLQNVHDTLRWSWTNNGRVAVVTHDSFLPHGETVLSVRDAGGTEVYNGPLESPEDAGVSRYTAPGPPGVWTIELRLYGVDGGRIDVGVERAPAP